MHVNAQLDIQGPELVSLTIDGRIFVVGGAAAVPLVAFVLAHELRLAAEDDGRDRVYETQYAHACGYHD